MDNNDVINKMLWFVMARCSLVVIAIGIIIFHVLCRSKGKMIDEDQTSQIAVFVVDGWREPKISQS